MNRFGFFYQSSNLILIANHLKSKELQLVSEGKCIQNDFGRDQGKNSVSQLYKCDLKFTLYSVPLSVESN